MIGYAIVFLVFGPAVAAVVSFALGFAGAPAALLAAAVARRHPLGQLPIWGVPVTAVCQSYVALAWVALVLQFVQARVAGNAGVGVWLFWLGAFITATAPGGIAARENAAAPDRNAQHLAAPATTTFSVIGFFAFQYRPALMQFGWAWVPQL